MITFKNIFFMGSSTAVRLVSGLLSFALMARLLGPVPFGIVMFWLSVATLVTLVCNYGFTSYVLREIGAYPDTAHTVMSEVLSAKILIGAIVLILSVVALPFLDKGNLAIYLLLLLAQLADSTSDFLNVGYRATNRYDIETRIATAASVLQLGLVAGIVWSYPTATIAAFAYFVSRSCVLVMTWISMRQYFAALKPASVNMAWHRIRAAVSYAADFGLQSLFGQIDSIVLNCSIGPSAVGLYQAGMRLFLGGSQVATVLGNVFIPTASRAYITGDKFYDVLIKLQVTFIGVGIIGAIFFCALPQQITFLLYGHKYQLLSTYLPLFGILFLVRFFASGWGITLTISGNQGIRSKIIFVHWLVLLAAALYLVPEYGVAGWLYSLIFGNLLLSIAYLFAVLINGLPNLFGYVFTKRQSI